MKWSDDLKIGVPEIDEQHKALIQAVNDLFDACSKGLGRKKIGETLEFLKNYVVTHFRYEEALQKRVGYPGYEEHRKIHTAFVSDVQKYADQFEKEGPTISFVASFNAFVSNWLLFHISREDKKIGEHIRAAAAR